MDNHYEVRLSITYNDKIYTKSELISNERFNFGRYHNAIKRLENQIIETITADIQDKSIG